MSVIVFAENWNGKFKKSTYEVASYGAELAQKLSTSLTAVVIGSVADDELTLLGKYGVSKVIIARNAELDNFLPQAYGRILAEIATKEGAQSVVFSLTYNGKNLAGRVAARLKAGLVAGAINLPSSISPLTIQKKCFSGKGLTDVVVHSTISVIGLTPNAFQIITKDTPIAIEGISVDLKPTEMTSRVKETVKTSGTIALTEAELVVSAGRGLKGPENWGMIEELATELHAGLACSKPVADIGWRPHHEHVGQTGITIGPNLYVAVGISGAIQHLAGVSSSKVIVVINNDAEAPFFKAADYGVIGDAFEVVPRFIESIKKLKASHN